MMSSLSSEKDDYMGDYIKKGGAGAGNISQSEWSYYSESGAPVEASGAEQDPGPLNTGRLFS